MNRSRFFVAFFVLALLLALVPAGMAQDSSTFGLSSDDYTAFTDANSASAQASSAQYDFKFNFTGQGMVIDLAGKGLYSKSDAGPLFDLALTGTSAQGDVSTPVDVELRLIGDTLYLKNATLDAGQWHARPLADLATMVSGSNPMAAMLNPAALLKGDFSGAQALAKSFQAQVPTLKIADYIHISRSGDQFTSSLDIANLIGSKEVTGILVSLSKQGQSANSSQSDAQMAGAAAMVATMLKTSELKLDQWVTDGKISRALLTFGLSIDPKDLGQTGDPINVAATFDINITGYDGEYTLEVPADAIMMTPEATAVSS